MKNANAVLTRTAPRHGEGPVHAIAMPVCPHCGSSLTRVHRRLVDRLTSLFMPVWRYRCNAENGIRGCAWVGNRAARSDLDGEPPQTAFGDMSFGDMAQITLNCIGDAVLVVDLSDRVTYLNKVAEKLTGWSSASALGKPVEEVFCIVDGTTRDRAVSPSMRAISEGRVVELELGSVLIRKDGTDLAIEDSAAPIISHVRTIVGAVIVFHDARESRTVMAQMSHHAHYDSLTGLPNRLLLMERLNQAIGMASRYHKQIALLFLDLDHFKDINDSFGHAVGDHLLRNIAADIVSCVRTTDTVSRLGGDEFVILLTQIEAMRDAAQIAEKLLAKFAQPRLVDGHELNVTLSIGISSYPENGLDSCALMQTADSAMYDTKSRGRNSFQFCHGQADAVARRTFT